jgi:DNA-binding NarL/FixJ family response regulator
MSTSRILIFLLSDSRFLREALARVLNTQGDILLVDARDYSADAVAAIARSGCDVLLADTPYSKQFVILRCAGSNAKVVHIDREGTIAHLLSAIRTVTQASPSLDRMGSQASGYQHFAT